MPTLHVVGSLTRLTVERSLDFYTKVMLGQWSALLDVLPTSFLETDALASNLDDLAARTIEDPYHPEQLSLKGGDDDFIIYSQGAFFLPSQGDSVTPLAPLFSSLDLYSRILTGQIDRLADATTSPYSTGETLLALRKRFQKPGAFPGAHASWSIYDRRLSLTAIVAYNLYLRLGGNTKFQAHTWPLLVELSD